MKRLPKGFGSVQKMTGSRRKPYGARIWDAKQARHFYIGYYETMEEALAALHEYHKSPYEYDKKDMTLKDCLNILLRQRVNVSESTQKNYEYKLKALGDIAFQNVRFISPGILEKWMDTSNYSPYTKRQYLSYVKQLLDIAVDEGIISKNPASKVALKKEDEEKIHKPISFLDLKKLWDDKENNIAQLILIMCYTGMRPGELLQIKKENIFLDEKYMIGGIKTQSSKNRVIPISSGIMPFISSMYQSNKKYLVEYNGKNICYVTLKKYIRQYTEDNLSIPYLPHDGRHTFATLAKAAQIDMLHIKLIMGHKVQDITESVYIHTDNQALIASSEKVYMFSIDKLNVL